MSSVGQAVGMVAGGAIGSFFGLTALGASVGGMIGSAIDPPKGPNIIGPRLDDLSVQTSTYGAPLARAYGTAPVTGNLFWLEGDKIKETTATEEQGGKGGPSQSTTTYHYSATFGVGLLHVPAGSTVSLRRLWIDTDLVYDADSSDIESIIASQTQSGVNFTFYPGADDQLPSPRMQADKGAANVSAYPGMCYVVMEDLGLEKYSNTLMRAQVKAELVIDSVPTAVVHEAERPFLIRNNSGGNNERALCAVQLSASGAKYSVIESEYWSGHPTLTYFCTTAFSDYAKADAEIDIAPLGYINDAPRRVIFNQCDELCSGFMEIDYGSADIKFHLTKYGESDVIFKPFPATALSEYNAPGNFFIVGWFAILKNNIVYLFNNEYNYKPIYIGIDGFIGESSATYQIQSAGFSDNYIFAVQHSVSGTTTTVYKFDLSLNLVATFSQTVIDGHRPGIYVVDDSVFYTATRGYVYKWVNGVVVDTFPGAVDYDFSIGGPTPGGEPPGFFCMVSDSPIYCVSFTFTASSVGQLHFTIAADSVASTAAKLRDIITDECALAGIAAGNLDLNYLTNHDVRGYKIAARSSVRAALEPLQAAFPFDVAASGYKLKFVSRGGASVATIPTEDLGATVGGDLPVLLPISREMESQLPYRVNVRYSDASREYDIGEQYAERPAESLNEHTVELAIVLAADEAAQKAEVLLEKEWVERTDIGPFTLPPTWSELEAADVVTIEHRGQQHETRLTRVEYLPDGRLQCQAKLTRAASYTSTAQGSEPQILGQSLVPLKGSTSGYLLDIPRIRSEQDVPGMSYGLVGMASGWPGGVMLRSDDSGQTFQSIGSAKVIAKVFDTDIALAAHHGFSIDNGSVLTVTPRCSAHTLSGVTEDQLYAHVNIAAYGTDGRWEIVCFKTVTDNTGSYTLKDFLRGLFGTEQYTGTHAVGDLFFMLDTTALGFFGLPVNAIGNQRLYRAVTQGAALDSADDMADTYDAVNLLPLAPVDINGSRSYSTYDWELTAKRRTRWPVEVFSGVAVPLGETAESYEIDVFDSGYSTLKRTITSTTGTAAYSQADQVADFGAEQSALYLKWRQVSSVVGSGYPLQSSIERYAPLDPYLSSTVLLMHMDGADDGTTFTDMFGHAATRSGTPVTKIGTKKYGTASGYFDGADDAVSFDDSPDWDFGTGSFTVEATVNFSSTGADRNIVSHYKSATDGWHVRYLSTAGGLQLCYGDTVLATFPWTPTTGIFYHIAFCRSGTDLRCFVDGVQVGTTVSNSTNLSGSTSRLYVGALYFSGVFYGDFHGYIDEVRITKAARYTTNFTPPTEAYPDP